MVIYYFIFWGKKMKIINFIIAIILSILISSSVFATCDLTEIKDLEKKKDGAVRLLARDNNINNFILDVAKECENDDILVKNTALQDYDYFPFVQTMKQAPAGYTAFISENDSLGILLYEGLAASLNYYLDSNGITIPEERIIKVDGKKITAIAYAKDTKHLYYREDILEQAGLKVPTSFEEILTAAEKIKSQGLMEYPLGDLYNDEWQLTVQFINLYLSLGGELFKKDSAKPIFRNKQGIEVLEMMKSYSKFINPNLLTGSKDDIDNSWGSGEIAIGNFWASQYKQLSRTESTKTAIAPSFKNSPTPASTMWWKGFTVARYVVESEAMAAIYTMLHAFNEKTINEKKDELIWIIDGYETDPKASALILNEKAKTIQYPINPYITLFQKSVGSEILDYILNETKPKKTLKKMEKAYKELAKELEYL